MLLDANGALVAVDGAHADVGDELAACTRELLERAGGDQIEVSTGGGIVYALRSRRWTLAVVAGRFALSSLVFFDMREVLARLGE